jgi:hypothetical protein
MIFQIASERICSDFGEVLKFTWERARPVFEIIRASDPVTILTRVLVLFKKPICLKVRCVVYLTL